MALITTLLAATGAARAEGLYGGINLGSPAWREHVAGVGGQGSGLSGKLFGGDAVTPNDALEAGLMDLGHMRDGKGKGKADGAFVDGLGSLPLDGKWSLPGRVGLGTAHFSTPLGGDSSPAVKLGARLQYDIIKTLALRGEYEPYRFSNVLDNKANVGQFTLGLKLS